MGKRQTSVPARSRAKSHPQFALPQRVNRWLSASIVAAMMALSTVVIAAEIPNTMSVETSEVPLRHRAQLAASATATEPFRPSLQISQRIRRKDIWQEVQKRLPDLPQENQYINQSSGEVSKTNTLVRRMIEYHSFRRGRSPRSRFDWKLTLADYLGINEIIVTDTYPGVRSLRTNPLNGDRAAIRAMGRQQRQQLIDTLVSLYNPNIPSAFFESAAPSAPATSEQSSDLIEQPNKTPSRPAPPPVAEPGAADLLRPRP